MAPGLATVSRQPRFPQRHTRTAPRRAPLITYTDGSTQPYTISFPDWWSGGGDTVADLPYINNQSGRQQQTVHLYMASVDLQAGKTVQYVTLPDISHGVTSGNVAMHIFAVSTGG